MAINYNWGRKGALRNFLYRLRQGMPEKWKIAVWKQTAEAIFARQNYGESVPLFSAIELETRTRCNSTCSFCAANIHTDQRKDILMPEELYRKILADLKLAGFTGTLRYYVNNEPLLDKRMAAFIRLAKQELPAATTEIQTNGLSLNPRNGRELLEAGLDVMIINNYTSEEKVHKGVEAFLAETAPDFPDRAIRFHLRQVDEELLNRAGTAPNSSSLPEPLPLPCILPFDEIVVTADGRVSLCCQDHYFEEVMGNVRTESIADIWFGEKFGHLREALLKSDRTASKFCQGCDFRGFKVEHMNRSEVLKNRLTGDML